MASRERQDQWWLAWLNSDAGKALEAKRRKEMEDKFSKPLLVGADGSFRADDVTAGQYEVNVRLRVTWKGDLWDIAARSARLTVPPMDGGRSDEPLQMDPITVVPLGKYKVGDVVYDLPLKSTDGQKLKLSDFRGRYVLLETAFEGPGPADPRLTAINRAYGEDSRLVMLRITARPWISAGQTPARQPDIPWKQVVLSDGDETASLVLERNFVARWGGAWLIGPDGKVVALGLGGDGISAAVKAALGAPAAQAGAAGH